MGDGDPLLVSIFEFRGGLVPGSRKAWSADHENVTRGSFVLGIGHDWSGNGRPGRSFLAGNARLGPACQFELTADPPHVPGDPPNQAPTCTIMTE